MAPRDEFFLWHLEHLGVLTRSGSGWAAQLWDLVHDQPPVTVAIIDSGLDTGHPNLEAAMAGPQVDFSPSLLGAVYANPGQAVAALRRARDLEVREWKALIDAALAEVSDHAARSGLDLAALSLIGNAIQTSGDPMVQAQAFLRLLDHRSHPAVPSVMNCRNGGIDKLDLSDEHKDHLSAIARDMTNGYPRIDIDDPAFRFGAHATACAGLVGARPPKRRDHPFYAALPYYGVNPHCLIQSFATPYSHEIRPVTHALLAAYLSGAEVILMPRGVPDVGARKAMPVSPRRSTRIDTPPSTERQTALDEDQALLGRLETDWDLLESLLRAVSKRRYLVLAAGNDGMSNRLACPAAQMIDTSDAIVVAAVNRRGYRTSYSNGLAASHKLLHMVSDDGEVVTRDAFHMGYVQHTDNDFDYEAHVGQDLENRFSPWAPLSLDVRGAYGFAALSGPDRPGHGDGVDIVSLYTLFGGTSAAASLAAGVISLLMQTEKISRQEILNVQQVEAAMKTAGLRPQIPIG